MIGSNNYSGPQNPVLVKIQHEMYWGLASYLFHYAKERYLKAGRLLGVETELSKKITRIENVDHRVLQTAHDDIAAFYVAAVDKGQIPLFRDAENYEEYLRREWASFFHREVREMVEVDAITNAILIAVAYENTEPEQDAESVLLQLLRSRYEFATADDLSRFRQPGKMPL